MGLSFEYFGISNMHTVGSQYWNQVHGYMPDDVRKDEEGLQTMRSLAQNINYYTWILPERSICLVWIDLFLLFKPFSGCGTVLFSAFAPLFNDSRNR